MLNNLTYRILAVLALVLCAPISLSDTRQSLPFSLSTEVITQGSLVIGQLKLVQFNSTQLKANHQIKLNGKNLLITANGQFVFGVGRDEMGELILTSEHTSELGQKVSESFIFSIQQRQWKVEKIDGLPASKVNPRSAKLIERIRKETKLVKQARATNSQRLDFTKLFIKPAQGRISGVYGSQRILNGIKKRPHYGQDIANKVGTKVIAPIGGVVTLAENDLFYSGGTIVIDHGYGVNTTYLHLSQINVKVGQTVNQKDKIGEIGATGRATGPHLDWRLNWNATRLDPALLVKAK